MLPTQCDVIHSDDLGPVVGMFHGVPVRSYNPIAVEDREILDTKIRVRTNSKVESSIEILPGEVICKDNMVRRDTAAAAMFTKPSTHLQGRRVSINVARLLSLAGAYILWRPEGNDDAIVLDEPVIASAATA